MSKNCFFFLFLFFVNVLAAETLKIKDNEEIPGRLGYSEISVARFGEMRVFFYMTPEKYELTRTFIKDVNERMIHGMVKAEIESPILEVTPIATIHTDPIEISSDNVLLYVDQTGTELFIEHAQKVKNLAEKALGISISALSQQMSMIMNFDANKFHRDQCEVQYEFLKNHPKPIPEYTIYQDLTLFDWEMGRDTLSGTIVQDQDSEDSFLLTFFSSEIVCNAYTEPALYHGPNVAPEYPGASTLLPHSPIACIDRYGGWTCGSGKGKRISVAVRGLVPNEEIIELEKRSKVLAINRPIKKYSSDNSLIYSYPNGIMTRELKNPPPFAIKTVFCLDNQDHVEVYSIDPSSHKPYINYIKKVFGIITSTNQPHIRRFVKRDSGFSHISLNDLDITDKNKIVIINRSKIPKEYKPYSLSQDFTTQGLPWIQFYNLPQEWAMCVSGSQLKELLLTPIEEILFRDADVDIVEDNPNVMNDKIVTEIDVLVF